MVDILAFGAHPDDIEFGCGGILCKAASQKKSIVMVDLSLGQKGSSGTMEERRKEGEAAAKLIGAKRLFLDFVDCEIFDSYEARLKLVKILREQKPKLVIAPLWKGEENHPDHLACGILARHACRYARFKNILPEIPIHRIDGILHYPFPVHGTPDFLVDVSTHVEKWKEMMLCHQSQHLTNPYYQWILNAAKKWGVSTSTEYAQGLIKGNPIIIDDVLSIAKGTREI